jgi:hypothetical protein
MMNALSKNRQSTSVGLNKLLLLSAATSALLCFSTDANAACSLTAPTPPYGTAITCATGAGNLAAVGPVSIAASSLQLAVQSGAAISDGLSVAGGDYAFAMSVAQASGDTTSIAGNIFIDAAQSKLVTGNTVSVDNAGTLADLTFWHFGDAITITNQASGMMGAIEATTGAGTTLTNLAGGTIGDVDLDYLDPASVSTVAPLVHDKTTDYSTNVSTDVFTQIGGLQTVKNSGTAGDMDIYGVGIVVTNSGTAGDLYLYGSDSWGHNHSYTTTEVYLDTSGLGLGLGSADDSNKNGIPDDYQETVVQEWTTYGGAVTVTNSGTLASVYGEANDDVSLTNSGKISGDVQIEAAGDGDVNEISTGVTTLKDDGTTITRTYSSTDAITHVGGKATLTNAAAGEIDGNVIVTGLTSAKFDNAGAFKGSSIDISASATDRTTTQAYTLYPTTTLDHTGAPVVTTDPATPPNTTTTVDNETWVDTSLATSDSKTTYVSVGGTADFVNEAKATIGVSGSPVDISIVGDTSASLENAGTIFAGTVTLTSTPSTQISEQISSDAITDTIDPSANGSLVSTRVDVDDTVNPVYTSSLSSISTSTYGEVQKFNNTSSTTYDAGAVSLTNSGALNGAVDITTSGTGAIDNSGTITGNISIVSLSNGSNSHSGEHLGSGDANSYTLVQDHEVLAGYDSKTPFLTESFSTDGTANEWFKDATTTDSSTVGTAVSLVNEKGGVIGTDPATNTIYVEGQASATVQNDGTINGQLNLSAYEGTHHNETNVAYSRMVETTGLSKAWSTGGTLAGAILTGGTLNHDLTQSTFHSIESFASSDASANAATGGAATMTNTSLKSMNGDVQINGVSLAELDNSGAVKGNVWINASGSSSATADSYAYVYDNLSLNSLDHVYADNGKGVKTTTTTSEDKYDNTYTFNDSSSGTQTSVGGDGVLNNAAAGIIGTAGSPVYADVYGDKSATIDNAGTIIGTIYVSGRGGSSTHASTNTQYGEQANDTNTVIVHVDDSTVPVSYDSSAVTTQHGTNSSSVTQTDSYISTPTEGTGLLTNSGTITAGSGSVQVHGFTSASLDNTGTITGGSIAVGATGAIIDEENVNPGSYASGNMHNWTYETDDTTTYDAGILTTGEHAFGSDTYGYGKSLSSKDSELAAGGDASLSNGATGVIGDITSYMPSVSVTGGTSASFSNDGTAYVGATILTSDALSQISTHTYNESSIENVTYDTTAAWTYDIAKSLKTDTAYDSKATDELTDSWVDVSTSAHTDTGGTASYTGAGDLYGNLSLQSAGDASVNNSGWIGSVTGQTNVSLVAGGTDYSSTTTETYSYTGPSPALSVSSSISVPNPITNPNSFSHWEDSNDIAGKIETYTYDWDKKISDEVVTSSSTKLVDGSASLVNSGTIGGDASYSPRTSVVLNGVSGATVSNSGLINGNVSAVAGGAVLASASDDLKTLEDTLTGQVVVDASGKTTVTTTVETETLTHSRSSVSTSSTTYNAALATGANAVGGTITGDLRLSGVGGATLTNAGSIWGNAGVQSTAVNLSSKTTLDEAETQVRNLDTGADTLANDYTYNYSNDVLTTSSSAGGNVVLNNSGTIGYRINNSNGHTYFFDGNGDSNADGGISAIANGTVSITNAKGGVIAGGSIGISAQAAGSTTVDEDVATELETVKYTSKSDGLSDAITVYHDLYTDLHTRSVKATGGTATLTNNGTIAQRFADAYDSTSSTQLTPVYNTVIAGQAGASVVNNGLIGGNLVAASLATNEVYSDQYTSTNDYTDSYLTKNNTQTITTVTSLKDVTTAVGGAASISNSAGSQIGVDVLNSIGTLTGTSAAVVAYGQKSASLSNDGTIQGGLIGVFSDDPGLSGLGGTIMPGHSYDSDAHTYTHLIDETVTNTTAGKGYAYVSGSDKRVESYEYDPTGGTATLANTGKISSSTGAAAALDVYGYAGATLTNAKTGSISVGTVDVESWGMTRVQSTTTTTNYTNVAGSGKILDTQQVLTTETDTASGGKALLDNAGKISGNVKVSGFLSGTVTNEAGASISGNVVANSANATNPATTGQNTYAYANYSLSTTVNLVGPTGGTPGVDTYLEKWTTSGGSALVDNFGTISGSATADALVTATVTNEASGTVGSIIANSLFSNSTRTNDSTGGGIVTTSKVGGTAAVTNNGIVGSGSSVVSLTSLVSSTFANNGYVGGGASVSSSGTVTFTNAAAAQLDAGGYGNSFSGTSIAFTNTGTIGNYTPGSTGYGGTISFAGATTAVNTGIIAESLAFSGTGASTFKFAQGSILNGGISNTGTLALNFDGSGLYQGNIGAITLSANSTGAQTTTKTGSGTWFLTGSVLGLGNTTVSAGMLEFGTPLNASTALSNYGLTSEWDALQGTGPYTGNTAINPQVANQSVSSSLINQVTRGPNVTGNITIASGAAVEGRAIITGNVSNSGTLLAGWMLPSNASAPLGNLLDNSNQVLPSTLEINGTYTQSASGTLVANIAPSINRPARTLVGSQAEVGAPTSYWLSVSPFTADSTASSLVTVDGAATVAGTVKVYVNKGGLYVGGTTTPILTSTGTLSSTASVAQSAPSLFVSFGLSTGTSGGKNALNVVVNRTSYSSVAATANQTAIGKALDSAVPTVAAAIKANSFASVADFTNAQDMAGFLTDLDWQVTSAAQGAQVLGALSPDAYASLAAIDTGAGFRNQITHRLARLPGGAAPNSVTGAWLQGYGVSQSIDGHNGAGKLSGSTVGTSLGWDFTIDHFVLGVAGGYSRTTIDTPAKAFDGAINAYQVGGYAVGTWDKLYLDAILWADFGNGHVTRTIAVGNRVATAAVKPSEFRADLEGGYRFQWQTTGLTPYLNLSIRDARLDNITESGVGGLGYKLSGIGDTLFTPQIGVKLDDKFSVNNMISIQPLVGLGIAFQPKVDDITAQFIGGGDAFQVNGAADSTVSFAPDAGLNISIGNSISVQLAYSGMIGSNRSSHGGWVGLRGSW